MNLYKHHSVTLQQAVQNTPTLARLSELAGQSAARMALIRPLLPPALRTLVRPGMPEPDSWCILVPHAAAAAKLRQLVPALLQALAAGGHPLQSLQVKIASAP
ncbi:MAG: hypothetical protein Q4G71_10690 [Pseudomonadota bacterium]|nr:hypothetical protein [Pseudomonadota bacterium]